LRAEVVFRWVASGLGWMRKLRGLRRVGTTWRGSKVALVERRFV
jgi:hypothetical protein